MSTDICYNANWEIFTSKGDTKAFAKIYYDNYDTLHYIGLKYTSDVSSVEDSIQNLFVNLLKNRVKLNPVVNVGGYLIKSFRRQLFLDLKKQKTLTLYGQLTEPKFEYFNTVEDVSYQSNELDELYLALKKSLFNLSDKQREIVYLRYDCDLSYEEISHILEISVESCYQSVYRSMKTIKAGIEQMRSKGKIFIFFLYSL